MNVYGQKTPHDHVMIVGTREDLIKLSAMIGYILHNENGYFDTIDDFYTFDGEGYNLGIRMLSEKSDEKIMNKLKYPYSDKEYQDTSGVIIQPEGLFRVI